MQTVRCGPRPEFRYQNTANDECRAEERARAEALAQKNQRSEPREYRFEGDDERRVGRRKMLLRPALDGEGGSRSEDARDRKGDKQARRRMEVRAAPDRQGEQHKQRSDSDLHRAKGAGAGEARGVSEREQVSGEGDRAGQGETFAKADTFEERDTRAGRRGQQDEAREGNQCSSNAGPAGGGQTGWLDSRDEAEQRDDDHDQAGDEGGF